MNIKWILISCGLQGCIINPTMPPIGRAVITPSPSPSPAPTLKPSPSPSPSPTPIPFSVKMPAKIPSNITFEIEVTGMESSTVSIVVDKKYPLGNMIWSGERHVKYFPLKLNTPGIREIEFNVDGVLYFSQKIEVTQ